MNNIELYEIFEPAYPCRHLSGICRGTCTWQPEGGLVPRGFGGATASPDMVRLVIVTDEPGNPGDDEYYGDSFEAQWPASEILSAVLSNRMKHLAGWVQRSRGTDKYNPNMRKILDFCWGPYLTIDEQLERTWITNSVKCSPPNSGDPINRVIAKVCIDAYLKKELELFSNAFILALGDDAVIRLRYSDLHFDCHAKHPSARPKDNPEPTWRSAGEKFQRWLGEDRAF